MYRRSFLGSVVMLGAVGAVASGLSTGATVSDVEADYPSFSGVGYHTWSQPTDDPRETPVPFESLSPEHRFEVATAVRRGMYITSESPSVMDSDLKTVEYRGEAFDIGVGVSHGIGRGRGPDATELATFDAVASGTELEFSLTNDHTVPLEVRHSGRPYFGVATAVGETSVLLHHDRYVENGEIQIEPITRSNRSSSLDRTTTLDPGDSLREAYAIGDSLPDDSVVYLSAPVRNESIELAELVTGRISLET